jgi:hypothetical protein
MEQLNNWKTKTIAIGVIAGLIFGVAAAMIVVERAEREGTEPSINAGDGVRLGLGVLGLMRLIADMGDKQ